MVAKLSSDLFKIAGQIEIYLERVIPKLEPAGGIPENPMNRKERGSGRPPVSEHVMELWDANPQAGQINEVLTQAARTTESQEIEGRPMWKILADCLWDHTAIRRWKAEGGIDERRFWGLCMLLASRLAIKHSTPNTPYSLRVYSHPRDAQAKNKGEEVEQATKLTLDDSYKRIACGVAKLEAQGYSRDAAISKKAASLMVPEARVRRALEYVESLGGAA